ncbi:YcnI family protein [Cellulomonas sp. HZM]|uniref:YcnI family copper-binding membrane protein n=1 Tax=Cellulomonas sp. HZM TaxID=1454010 RepID=UPI000555B173|nr:YcnI family protein [Cellulomonas sp. HZM]
MPSKTSLHPTARRVLVGAVAAALVVLPAAAASAHVRVIPESTAAGGWTVLTFRVPTESATASTTKVVVDLPTATPLTHVGTRPLPGWTVKVDEGELPAPVDVGGATITKAPLHVTWTADADAAIAPGQFQELELQVGPLPAAGTELVLPAHQTYSDGTVVDWDEKQAGADEPENPAPAFTVTAAADESPAAPTAPASSPATPSSPTVTAGPTTAAPEPTAGSTSAAPDATASSSSSAWTVALGAVALAVAVAALVVALVTRRRGGDLA